MSAREGHLSATALEVPAGGSPRHSRRMSVVRCEVCGSKGIISGSTSLALEWCKMAEWHKDCAAAAEAPAP